MKHKNLRDLDNAIFSYLTPNGSIALGIGLFLLVVAMLTFVGCAATPEEIRTEADKINQNVNDTAEKAIAVKESAQAIRDNVKDKIEEVIE